MQQRVRLKDIGARLGVDKSTVSMALRGHPRIPEGTRARVRAMADELGYVQDPLFSQMAQRRWAGRGRPPAVSIGLLSWSGEDYPDQVREVARPLRAAVERLGYGYERLVVGGFGGVEKAVRILEARGVRGLVVTASAVDSAWSGFPWERFCGVEILAGRAAPTGLPVIRHDTIGAMLDAGRRVAAQRPRRAAIAVLQQDPPSLTDERDEAAALLVLRRWAAAGIDHAPLQVFRNSSRHAWDVLEWLTAVRPEAAILPNSAVKWALPENDIPLLRQTRIILQRRHGEAGFAGYEQPMDRIAALAAQQVDALLRGDRRGLPALAETTVVPAHWNQAAG
jgi:DNA-binding LacI/PurR family transcriptional regulator